MTDCNDYEPKRADEDLEAIEALERVVRDASEWLQLGRRQYSEMDRSGALCPTMAGLNVTEVLIAGSSSALSVLRGSRAAESFINPEHARAIRETAEHIRKVQLMLFEVVSKLTARGIAHDRSKWSNDEWPYFARSTARLRGLTYGSPEYRQALDDMRPGIEHHYAENRHHPEHHAGGISEMDLLDLVEMLADWKAATLRHADGDLAKSIKINADRFEIPPAIVQLLETTARNLSWVR